MFRIDFYALDVCSGRTQATARFSYYGCAAELPVLLAEWITTVGAIAEVVAAVAADPAFTTWYVCTDCAQFPRIAIRPIVPVH